MLEAWNVIARKISWAKSVYGDFVPSALGDAGLDDNLVLLRPLTERITGEARDQDGLQTTSLAGIETPIVAPDGPTTSVIEVIAPATGIESWAEWASRRGMEISGTQRRRGTPPPSQLDLGMG